MPVMLFPLRFTLRPSRRLCGLLAAVHLLVACALLYLWQQPLLMMAAFALLAGSAWQSGQAQRRWAGVDMLCHETGEWSAPALGVAHEAPVLPEPIADLRFALWLGWHGADGRHRAMMLCPDHFACAQDWHRFRIWFRHKTVPRTIRERLEMEEAAHALRQKDEAEEEV